MHPTGALTVWNERRTTARRTRTAAARATQPPVIQERCEPRVHEVSGIDLVLLQTHYIERMPRPTGCCRATVIPDPIASNR